MPAPRHLGADRGEAPGNLAVTGEERETQGRPPAVMMDRLMVARQEQGGSSDGVERFRMSDATVWSRATDVMQEALEAYGCAMIVGFRSLAWQCMERTDARHSEATESIKWSLNHSFGLWNDYLHPILLPHKDFPLKESYIYDKVTRFPSGLSGVWGPPPLASWPGQI